MTVEMLVRRVSKVGKTDMQNAQLTKRGDVIVVKEAPCAWTTKEHENPEWVIISIEGLSFGDALSFTQNEQPIAAAESQPLLKRRMIAIDLDSMTATIKESEKVNDVEPYRVKFTHTKEDLILNRVIKAPAETILI